MQSYCKFYSTGTGVTIKAEVFDVTGGGFTKIGEKVLENQHFVILMLPNDIRGNIGTNSSIKCTLQAGRNYLVRLMLYTEAKAGEQDITNASSDEIYFESDDENNTKTSLVNWSLSDFHNNTADGQGLDYDYVKIQWN